MKAQTIDGLRDNFRVLLQSILAVSVGLILGLIATWIAGANPLDVFVAIVRNSLGTPEDLGLTLFYMTPLIFTGLAISFAFHAGLFSIGAEGQWILGALGAAGTGILFPDLPWPWAPIFAGVVAFSVGAIWGFIPGWLRAKTGSHEVITTIMLNFIAAGLASWLTLYVFKNPASQNPETQPIGPGYHISNLTFLGDTQASTALFLALIVAFLFWLFLFKSVRGYELRAVGQNEHAAKAGGIDSSRVRIFAMTISGGLAGLVGVSEVLGSAHCYKIGAGADYGFMGIAVALLGRGRPLGIIAAAFLFAALHTGCLVLGTDFEMITQELSMVLRALVIISVSADGLWRWMKAKPKLAT